MNNFPFNLVYFKLLAELDLTMKYIFPLRYDQKSFTIVNYVLQSL